MRNKQEKVTLDGRAIIRKNKPHIHEGEFRNNAALTHICLPPNIRKIHRRAFSGCKNLESIEFVGDQLESIGERAFENCQSLHSMTLPDGTHVSSYAFQGCTGLKIPIFNQSGTMLYAYPAPGKRSMYFVPERVSEIASTAFLDNSSLEEVVLPHSVTKIHPMAFCNCNIRSILIPSSVAELPENAFFNCTQLKTVILLGNTRIHYNAFAGTPKTMHLYSTVRDVMPHEKYWAIGSTFLKAEAVDLPDGAHLEDPVFLSLAAECAQGNSGSMWDLSCYFDMLASREEHPFFRLASNFWRFFAYLAGSPEAAAWYAEWDDENPTCQLPAILDESRSGEDLNGSIFRYLGYLDFEENVIYDIRPTANSGVTLVCTHPHDNGTWEAAHYQITYRDEYLNELPITTLYHHPASKPDLKTADPGLFSILGQAISASFKRNKEQRKGNPFFAPLG